MLTLQGLVLMMHRAKRSKIKRTFDIVLAAFVLMAMSPIIAGIAFMLLISDGRPILFRQRRIGHDGHGFTCYKFRTMAMDAGQRLPEILAANRAARATWERSGKLPDDPRTHRLGAWLRRTSLDELPQLWNVIKGDMSLVGPRPIRHDEQARYGEALARCYLPLRPGLTGIWQISGRSRLTYEGRIACDLDYAANWTLGRDVVILLLTIPAVLRRDGAF